MPPVSKYSPAPRLDAATDDTQVSDAPPIAPSLQDGADPAWVRLDLGLGERPPPALWRPDSPDLSDPSPPLETFLSALTQLPLGHNPLDPEQMAVLETAIDEGWAGPLLEKRLDLCDALHRATFLPDFPRHAAEAAFSVRVLVSTLRNHVGERNFWRDFQEDLDLTAFLPLRWKALDQQFSKLPPSERLEILSRVEILTGFVSMERADFWGGAEVYRYLRDKPLHPDAPVVLTRAKARLISLYNTALRELGEEEASKKETVRILRATAHLPVPLGKWTDSEFDEIFYYIHEALTLLPEGLSPLHPQFNVQAVSDSPLLTAFYDRLFQILAPVLQNLPAHWEGAHFFAARIAEPFFADPVLMDLDAVVGLNPLSLSDPGSRKKLAERIFRLSRGNQELQSFILRKLSLYCATESTRQDTILLLREMIPLSDPDAGKTFAIRDYSSLLGLSSPFLLLTSSRVARPWLWTREMHE
ncbi:MAG: hypothetical protein Q7T11_05580, partial [Deltaproteobacteria bacterium]|nr:hypothetical protein [Deltaproteobacteria bacterium]